MNRYVDHSLFDCPGKYTVRVATYGAKIARKPDEIKEAEQSFLQKLAGGQTGELAIAAEKAHVLCSELRKLGVEAFEFHDRHESYVCVGSFDWTSQKLPNGSDELNPDVVKVIKEYQAQSASVAEQGGVRTYVVPRTLKSLRGKQIDFDSQPVPCHRSSDSTTDWRAF